MSILQLIASLSLLVFIHELGHYAMARLFGARVEKFYLFFNPWFSLFKYKSKRSGTTYGIGWIPLGGYCQIAGMVDESLDTDSLKSAPKADEFRSKKAWQRLLIMAGGVLFNLFLALAIYIGISYIWGDRHLSSSSVKYGWDFSEVAEQAGFRDGDVIMSIDGDTSSNVLASDFTSRLIQAKRVEVARPNEQGDLSLIDINMPSDLVQQLLRSNTSFATIRIPFIIQSLPAESINTQLKPGQQVLAVNGQKAETVSEVVNLLTNQYRGQQISLTVLEGGIVKELEQIKIDDEGHIGVHLCPIDQIYETTQINYGLLESIPLGFEKAINTVSGYISSLKYIFTKEGAQSIGGLGTMAKLFPQDFSWLSFWHVSAFLSIILAVMNLLPIPALDGGHIVFILLEMITRRKLSDTVMMRIQTVGIVLLLLLMLYANFNDIYRYLIK